MSDASISGTLPDRSALPEPEGFHAELPWKVANNLTYFLRIYAAVHTAMERHLPPSGHRHSSGADRVVHREQGGLDERQ